MNDDVIDGGGEGEEGMAVEWRSLIVTLHLHLHNAMQCNATTQSSIKSCHFPNHQSKETMSDPETTEEQVEEENWDAEIEASGEQPIPSGGAEIYTMQSSNGMVTITPAGAKAKFTKGGLFWRWCY